MVELRKGDLVWFHSSNGVPIGARVKNIFNGQCYLCDDQGNEHRISENEAATLRPMHPTSVEGVDDMIRLGDMHEAGLLRNLHIRHKQGVIYTYIGSVLVAVNPYQLLPIYTADQVRLYHGRRLGELPPHVFAIADTCYFNMRRKQRNQCCIISGESGAGKTESTKLILQFLAAVSGQHSWIEQQILQANPILEAFGNAKTIRNDNSSRFGKYVEIFFNKDGVINGAHIEQYLLEKSRVCHQAPNERNYHIFYCMLSGMPAEQKKILSLGDAKDFNYLSGECVESEWRSDAEDYEKVRSALKILTFTERESWEIFKLLAAILHMGNVNFEATILNNMEGCDVMSSDHFTTAAKQLEVDTVVLGNSLTHRSIKTNREHVTKPLSSEQAKYCRDALVKAVYSRLFVWIFVKINKAVYRREANESAYVGNSIGLLDIFGFEDFKNNSFEQLCINYANEQLQQFFVRHVFKLEQAEYAKEGVVWKHIAFNDNQETLDLLAGKPLNILALIDEESQFPKGTDTTLLNKMNQVHGRNSMYIASRTNHHNQFGIQHFAGEVYYDPKGFLEKNRDTLSTDIIKLIERSSNKLLREIFESELNSKTAMAPSNRRIIMTPTNSLKQTNDSRRHLSTLSNQFRQSLESLMKALNICQPFFIRCFKPNDSKMSMVFDRELCLQQMRYSGMLETIKIRKLGYPIRHTFEEFLGRYRVLLKTVDCDPNKEPVQKCCDAICRSVIRDVDNWRIGKTKIFLKDCHDSFLEQKREEELNRKAVIIQRVLLCHKERKAFVNKKKAVVVVQKHWRGCRERKAFKKLKQGYARLQAIARSRGDLRQYLHQRAAAVTLQKHARSYLARKELKRRRDAYASQTFEEENASLAAEECESPTVTTLEMKQPQDEVDRQSPDVNDEEKVNSMFDFLPSEVESEERLSPKLKPATPEADPKVMLTKLKNAPAEDKFIKPEEEDDEFSFSRFAMLHFQGSATHTHIQQRLRQSLLSHEDEGDTLACLTVWWIILRFMGDMPEPRHARVSAVMDPIQKNLGQRQARRLSNLVGLDQKLLRLKQKQHRFGTAIGIRKPSFIPEEMLSIPTIQTVKEEDDILIGEGPTFDRPMTPLEKLHAIIEYGISRRGIRDEIYCQICKQLVDNKNEESFDRGWLLLSMCLSIFPPTELFLKPLQSFMCRGPKDEASRCETRLQRTLANGERSEPPCAIELQAAENKEPILTSVSLMDGQSIECALDSATTSAEVCNHIALQKGLQDTFGFSLYIEFYDKFWSLGCSGGHLMDAIFLCEQEERKNGREEKDAPWRLYFRKELFTPWYNCTDDPLSTDLIYRQVIHGLKSGDYQSDKEDDYIQLAAKHYYTQYGSSVSPANLKKVVQECINISLIEKKSETKLIQLVNTALTQGAYMNSSATPHSVKAEVVNYARLKWPIYFSKFFDVSLVSGPNLPQEEFVVAVSWKGISFQEGKERKFLELSYAELTEISLMSEDGGNEAEVAYLSTLRGDFTLRSKNAEEMVELVDIFLTELKNRSVYAVAQHDAIRQGDSTILSFKKADLLRIVKDGEYSLEEGWLKARNERTGAVGVVSKDSVMVLATLDKPTNEVLSLLSLKPEQRKPWQNSAPKEEVSTDRMALFSLREFSLDYFRTANKEKLWAVSKEPLKQPLLKSLQGNSELSQQACISHTAILKYMGDYPVKHARSPIELTDQIFGSATLHTDLRDEIYCQIMKQLTNNNNGVSVERGWQLLWLCCGLFPPSQSLLRHVQRFLESRPREPLASACLQRLQGMLSMEARKLPPHQVELDAIQQNSTQIFHKVHFPNETSEIFEVTTTTRIRDLCRSIANKLNISSSDGYSLFVKTSSKVVSMSDEPYFFDNLRQLTDTTKKARRVKEGLVTSTPYLVLFMRKLWFNVIPGKDQAADFIFHFPQELPKYLRGYHKVTKEDLFTLAGLLFRIRVDSDKSQFVMIPKMLKDLVPADQMKIMSPEDWKKHIISSYNKQAGMTVEEAKVKFLKHISNWPTFGCAFFEVKQTSERKLPSVLTMAISKQGVSLLNPGTKDQLAMYPFSKITNWSSGATYFHMTIGNLVKGNSLLCETSVGYKIDDLLNSYVNMYLNERQTARPRKQLFS
ncbi:unconventional myosin-VIIa [Chanos chanos]|uniref:Unconventional myosin-VIIa n=1 Tax=Chanos chanos TaxID=29144 RepID=A0A6J2VH12_CHACN|nr:unconventional myosin-VIIa-like [Chanos chanos]